ncbi:MAG: hypothetical protein ACREEJ_10235 [Ensifer adhaerens]
MAALCWLQIDHFWIDGDFADRDMAAAFCSVLKRKLVRMARSGLS